MLFITLCKGGLSPLRYALDCSSIFQDISGKRRLGTSRDVSRFGKHWGRTPNGTSEISFSVLPGCVAIEDGRVANRPGFRDRFGVGPFTPANGLCEENTSVQMEPPEIKSRLPARFGNSLPCEWRSNCFSMSDWLCGWERSLSAASSAAIPAGPI